MYRMVHGVQKGVDILAALRPLSLERPVYKVDAWLASGNLPGFPLFPEPTKVVHCAQTVQTMWFVLNTCLPFGSMDIWCMVGTEYLYDQPPVKTLGTESPMSFTGRKHFTCFHNSLLE